MDYHSIHGQDISSFDLPSTHRLPTVSAAQALEDISTDPRRFISTGIRALDEALVNVQTNDVEASSSGLGGFQRGQVAEIWGPPGSGKTAFGMQLTANVLKTGNKAIWLLQRNNIDISADGFQNACGQRLQDMISATQEPLGKANENFEAFNTDNLLHFTIPSIAHLIGLLCKPSTNSIPSGTCLIVIDSLSALFNHAFPKSLEQRQPSKRPGMANRRLQILQSLISALQKLAAARDILIVVLSQCATRMQAERGATLVPAINTNAWEQGIASRLVLFRNWAIQHERYQSAHFAGIQKLDGRSMPGVIGPIFAFDIQPGGLVEIETDSSQSSLILSTISHHKRKLGETDFELAGSEDEDYGWEDEDAAEIPTVPQWQGSEDILLGHPDDDGNQSGGNSDSHPQSPEASLH